VVLEKDREDQLDRWCEKEVLLTVKEQRNIIHEISKRKANWIGHILCRNCLLQQVIEGNIKGWMEVTGRRGRGRGKLGMNLSKGEDTYIWRRKLLITLWRELALEGVLGVSWDGLLNEWTLR
jgi:hypothetical protein